MMDLNDLFRNDTRLSGKLSGWLAPLHKQWVIQHNSAILEQRRLRTGTEEFPIRTLTHEELKARTDHGRTFKLSTVLTIILWVLMFGWVLRGSQDAQSIEQHLTSLVSEGYVRRSISTDEIWVATESNFSLLSDFVRDQVESEDEKHQNRRNLRMCTCTGKTCHDCLGQCSEMKNTNVELAGGSLWK